MAPIQEQESHKHKPSRGFFATHYPLLLTVALFLAVPLEYVKFKVITHWMAEAKISGSFIMSAWAIFGALILAQVAVIALCFYQSYFKKVGPLLLLWGSLTKLSSFWFGRGNNGRLGFFGFIRRHYPILISLGLVVALPIEYVRFKVALHWMKSSGLSETFVVAGIAVFVLLAIIQILFNVWCYYQAYVKNVGIFELLIKLPMLMLKVLSLILFRKKAT